MSSENSKRNTQEKIFSFLKFPRGLLENPEYRHISVEARVLLMMLLDRYELSVRNADKFSDENGGIFVIYTVEEIRGCFGCGRTKPSKLFKELEDNGIIHRRRTNGSRPSKIYINSSIINNSKLYFAKSDNKTLQSHKTELCNVIKSDTINTDNSNTYINNTDSSIIGFGRTEGEIREQIEYECLVCDETRKFLNEIVMIISDVLNGTSPTVRIGRDDMLRGFVISRFCRLRSEHILYVLSTLRNNKNKINNIKSYLVTLLYNAPATIENEATALFANNFGG